jgi:hydrogenase nickel incorporation protein HypB
MCVTCGCSGQTQHHHEHNHDAHHHHHDHHHEHNQLINLETEILAENNQYANQNRQFFNTKKALALNFVSSPGSGKTTLLEQTISQLSSSYPIYVVEGDQHTELDAQRIRQAGAQAYQIQTGKACHLDGHMVGHALEHLTIAENSLVFIENVGNLICPALFDLGEHARIVLISITEGEDKPLKYPDMFFGADLVLITKMDLLPHLNFDLASCEQNIRKINPKAKIIQLSAQTKSGFDVWLNWLVAARNYLL